MYRQVLLCPLAFSLKFSILQYIPLGAHLVLLVYTSKFMFHFKILCVIFPKVQKMV